MTNFPLTPNEQKVTEAAIVVTLNRPDSISPPTKNELFNESSRVIPLTNGNISAIFLHNTIKQSVNRKWERNRKSVTE